MIRRYAYPYPNCRNYNPKHWNESQLNFFLRDIPSSYKMFKNYLIIIKLIDRLDIEF